MSWQHGAGVNSNSNNCSKPQCTEVFKWTPSGSEATTILSTEKSLQCSSPPLIKPAAAQTSAPVSLAAAGLAVAFCISSSVLLLPAFVTTKKKGPSLVPQHKDRIKPFRLELCSMDARFQTWHLRDPAALQGLASGDSQVDWAEMSHCFTSWQSSKSLDSPVTCVLTAFLSSDKHKTPAF